MRPICQRSAAHRAARHCVDSQESRHPRRARCHYPLKGSVLENAFISIARAASRASLGKAAG